LKWNEQKFKRFIQDDQTQVGCELNSVQQGFLCLSTEHRMFDDYAIAMNPDVSAESSLLNCRPDEFCRITIASMISLAAILIVRPMGKYSIATSINLKFTFLRRTFYETIFANASSATFKALEKVTIITGPSTLI
jgi:hypothetical protein